MSLQQCGDPLGACNCRRANSDNERDGEVDQPPHKLQKLEAGCCKASQSLPAERPEHSREAVGQQQPSRPEDGLSGFREGAPDNTERMECAREAARAQQLLGCTQATSLQPAVRGMEEKQGQAVSSQQPAEHSKAPMHAAAGSAEAQEHDESKKRPWSSGEDALQANVSREEGRGIPLSVVVAAYKSRHEHDAAAEEDSYRGILGGSRGSSQTRCEACGDDVPV